MFGMKEFYVSASGVIQGHHGPLVLVVNVIVNSWHWKCTATSLAYMPAVSIPMALSRCSNDIPGRRPIIDFQRFFPVFVLMIRKLSNCLLCDPWGSSVLCAHTARDFHES